MIPNPDTTPHDVDGIVLADFVAWWLDRTEVVPLADHAVLAPFVRVVREYHAHRANFTATLLILTIYGGAAQRREEFLAASMPMFHTDAARNVFEAYRDMRGAEDAVD